MFKFKNPSLFKSKFTTFYSGDDAFDTELKDEDGKAVFDFDKYLETREDKYIPRKPGANPPTPIMCRKLSKKEQTFLQAKVEEGTGMLAYWVVALGLVAIGDEETKEELPEPLQWERTGSVRALTERTMEMLMCVDDGAFVGELATQILTETQKENSPQS